MTSPRPLAAIVVALMFVTGLAACGGGDDSGDETKVTTDTSAPGEKTEGTPIKLKARLSGAEEVPGPGVKDGVGALIFDVTPAQGCYDLRVTMGEKPLQAHIHKGAKGASGPVVVNLSPTFKPGEAAFTAEGCVGPIMDEAIAGLGADPAGYYVNVHSAEHPDGAMRGQLERS